jgi:hypothetical protein
MAVEVTAKGSSGLVFAEQFFAKLGSGGESTIHTLLTKLLEKGASVEVQWQAVKVTLPDGTVVSGTLPFNSNTVMKETLLTTQKMNMHAACYTVLSNAVNMLVGPKHYPGKPIPVPAPHIAAKYDSDAGPTTLHISKEQAKQLLEAWKKEYPELVEPFQSNTAAALAATLDGIFMDPPFAMGAAAITPVKLSEATLLGQPVFGTSGGSIYKVVAIGPRVKMAARLKAMKLSVRVEGNLNPKERAALTAMSFKDAGSHLSGHFGLNEVPAERIIGCLFFNPDVELTSKIHNLKEAAGGV